MKVLIVEPMQPCRAQEIPDTLDAMQAIVGGNLQAVYPFRDEVALVCNENGKNLDLPYNRPLTNDRGIPYDMICGTFFLAGVGTENFVSLTEEQIQKYTALYDNMVVLTAERPAAQAEIAPDDAMPDFAVSCQVSFRITCEDQGVDTMQDTFAGHVTGIFNSDEALAERTVGDLNFTFRGRCAEVQYTFARQDKDAASAEKFSEQCVRDVQDALEGYGCKIEKIDCFAEELEKDLSCAKDQSRGREPQGKRKKGIHHER